MTRLVVGLGNDARHDDGAGLEVARRVARRRPPGTEVVVGVPDLAALVELFGTHRSVVVVDATRSGAAAGTVVRCSGAEVAGFPEVPAVSTHGLSLRDALALGGTLAGRPPKVVVFGIEATDLSQGAGLTEAVEQGVTEAVGRVLREVGRPPAGLGAEADRA